MEIVGSALGVRSGGEDCAFVVLEHLEPRRDIGTVIVTRFKTDLKICAEERAAQFSNKFFGCIAFIAPALAAKTAIKPRGVTRPMGVMPISA